MSFPQSKPLLSGFSTDNETCNRAVGKMRPLRRAGPPTVKCRPATASRSLKSISNARNAVSSKAAGKDHMLNDALTANLLRYIHTKRCLFVFKSNLNYFQNYLVVKN